MSDYDDRLKDEERFAQEMETLAKIADANEWERRLTELIDRINNAPNNRFVNRKSALKWRGRLIKNLLVLRPKMTEAEATTAIDATIGLDPAN